MTKNSDVLPVLPLSRRWSPLMKIEDLLTDEEHAQLTKDLQTMAFQRIAAEAAAAKIVMH